MNYRTIFNPNYNFIGIILIALFITILLLLNKNIKYTIYIISKTFISSGILSIIFGFFINFFLNSSLPSLYKIFIQIITKIFISNLIYSSLFVIVLGIIGYGYVKLSKEKS